MQSGKDWNQLQRADRANEAICHRQPRLRRCATCSVCGDESLSMTVRASSCASASIPRILTRQLKRELIASVFLPHRQSIWEDLNMIRNRVLQPSAPAHEDSDCYDKAHASKDNVRLQFYPTLRKLLQ
jgi:hypothetical protein